MEVSSIFLNKILAESIKRTATNLHLSVGSSPIIRVNDKLSSLEEDVLTSDILSKIIESITNPNEFETLNKEKEITLVKTFSNSFRFRVNIFFQKNLPSISFNYIPDKIKSWEDLNLSIELKKLLEYKSGLLVVSGPSGSGKTTTVAAIVDEINKNKKRRIVTLENPIEYSFANQKSLVEQRNIGIDVESYEDGLDNCLREDVDLVCVGEVDRDFKKIIPYALELAAGNSLVVIEVNASSSIRALEKIISSLEDSMSLEAARYSLADVLLGVVNQRLLSGRGGSLVLASEFLLINSTVKSLIREGKIYQLESTIQTSRGEGMINMKRAVQNLLDDNKISQEEVKKIRI